MSFFWSKENEQALVDLINAGWSSQQIADHFGGGCTRNAVIGKANRLGLTVGKARNTNIWTPERLEVLIAMAKRGESGDDIARAVNKLPGLYISPGAARTRAATMGLSCGGGRAGQRAAWQAKPVKAPKPAEAERPVFTQTAPEGGVALLDISRGQCRWPVGDPRDVEGFRFCGAGVSRGSYCASHAALAYVRAERRTPSEAAKAERQIAMKIREMQNWF